MWQAFEAAYPRLDPTGELENEEGRTLRALWRAGSLLRPHTPIVSDPDDGVGCRGIPLRPLTLAEALRSIGSVLRGRLLLLMAWLGFALGRLLAGRNPFRSTTIAVPSRGLSGPWQRPSPLAFGCPGDPEAHRALPDGTGLTCATGYASRLLMRRDRLCAVVPDSKARVQVGPDGWVVSSRYEPELYGPEGVPWNMPAGTAAQGGAS